MSARPILEVSLCLLIVCLTTYLIIRIKTWFIFIASSFRSVLLYRNLLITESVRDRILITGNKKGCPVPTVAFVRVEENISWILTIIPELVTDWDPWQDNI